MKIAFAVFGFQVLCSVGFTAPSSITEFPDENLAFTGDDISTSESIEANSYLNHTDANVDLTANKINDSEIYENGQTAKEDRQRSFIFIQNTKSRLPWTVKTRGSFFLDVFNNPKEVFNDVDGHLSPFRVEAPVKNKFYNEDNVKPRLETNHNTSYSKTRNRNYYNSMNYPFSMNLNGKNRKSHMKRPKYVPDVGVMTAPTPADRMKSYYYRKGFKHQVKNIAQNNMYNSADDPKMNTSLNIQYQIGRHFKMPHVVPAQVTVIPTTFTFDKSPEASKKFSSPLTEQDRYEKLNKFINDIANGDHSAEQLNCYNRECAPRSRHYRVNMNNGILRGSNCVCQGSRSLSNAQAQRWRARKKMATASEKASIRPVNVNESEDSYEALMKETKKLTKIVEGME